MFWWGLFVGFGLGIIAMTVLSIGACYDCLASERSRREE